MLKKTTQGTGQPINADGMQKRFIAPQVWRSTKFLESYFSTVFEAKSLNKDVFVENCWVNNVYAHFTKKETFVLQSMQASIEVKKNINVFVDFVRGN